VGVVACRLGPHGGMGAAAYLATVRGVSDHLEGNTYEPSFF
jgi:hypothetical protein